MHVQYYKMVRTADRQQIFKTIPVKTKNAKSQDSQYYYLLSAVVML